MAVVTEGKSYELNPFSAASTAEQRRLSIQRSIGLALAGTLASVIRNSGSNPLRCVMANLTAFHSLLQKNR
jgi:hypothetical protein